MAALRCGYGVGHPDIMKKIAPFGAGYSSLNIGAYGAFLATLQDHEHLARSREFAKEVTAFYKQNCNQLGLRFVTGPVDLPYILIELGNQTNSIQEELERRKIFVKKGEFWAHPLAVTPSLVLIASSIRTHRQKSPSRSGQANRLPSAPGMYAGPFPALETILAALFCRSKLQVWG